MLHMKTDGRRSDNIEDRRGMSTGAKVAGVGGLGVIVAIIIAVVTGQDPQEAVRTARSGDDASEQTDYKPTPEEEKLADFVSVVLASTEDVWNPIYKQRGKTYEAPKLVLFSDSVDSACGRQGKSVGPFYCPADKKVYIDLSFYAELRSKLGAPGDFAQAYVIGHEIGHHIQNLEGTSTRVHKERTALVKSGNEVAANALSVRQELQADCLAGVWAHHADKTQKVVEAGDIAEAMRAAQAIGDDNLQRQARGYVSPESFTHGTSEQRMAWFNKGFSTGNFDVCDTFNANPL